MAHSVAIAESTIRHFFQIDGAPLLDRWLRFHADIDARYDREHSLARASYLRQVAGVGLILYNACALTGFAFVPDIAWLSIGIRLGIMTPVGLFLIWLNPRIPIAQIEWISLLGMTAVFAILIFLLWSSNSPLVGYNMTEMAIVIAYGNTMLALRFRYAVWFTAIAFVSTVAGIQLNDAIDPALRSTFVVLIALAGITSLYSNFLSERRRCRDYLLALGATLQAETADMARRRFQDLSRTDALTELPNRRHLSDTLDGWFAKPDSIALIMIDIDHFKLYNDALGHPAGDQCLRRVAQVLMMASRTSEVFAARLGGEEFVLAARGVTPLDAAALARSLLQGIERVAIPHPGRPDGVGIVTVSLGVALRLSGDRASQDEIFAAADRALYRAKTSGRNRFVMDEDPVEPLALRA